MDMEQKLRNALSAIDDALRALKRAHANSADDPDVYRAIRELNDAENLIQRALNDVRGLR